MATISLRNFGGMSPASVTTANNPSVASYVRNLDLRQSDFRPFPQAAATGPVMTPGYTLYRFDKTGFWITRTGFVDFVRGPIPNDATERTYYTGDGAPKVTDDTGSVRQLGVPAPVAPVGVTVNATDQYSTDDAAADQSKKLAEIMKAIRDNYAWEWTGLTPAELADRFEPAPAPALWSYRFRVPGVLAGGVFTPTNPNHANLIDDQLHWGLLPQGDGSTLGFSALDLRTEHIVLGAGIAPALLAIADPSDKTGAKKLLNADQVGVITSTLADNLKPVQQARDRAIERLREAKKQFVLLADSGSTSVAGKVAAVQAFYASPAIVTLMDSAIDQAVTSILNALHSYNSTGYTEPGSGGSGGGWDYNPGNHKPDYQYDQM